MVLMAHPAAPQALLTEGEHGIRGRLVDTTVC